MVLGISRDGGYVTGWAEGQAGGCPAAYFLLGPRSFMPLTLRRTGATQELALQAERGPQHRGLSKEEAQSKSRQEPSGPQGEQSCQRAQHAQRRHRS